MQQQQKDIQSTWEERILKLGPQPQGGPETEWMTIVYNFLLRHERERYQR